MLVQEVMTHEVKCTSPETTIRDAARLMRDLDVGPIPICDGDRLVGLVTDRDIVVRAVAEGLDVNSTRVSDVMSPGIIFCFEDQETSEVARIMEDNQVRRLVVLNRSKRLVGIVSLGDLATQTDDDQLIGNTLETISEPTFSVGGMA
jgi:CBS domain-containing protein